MVLIVFILFTLLLNNVVYNSDAEPMTNQLFEQKLDHFNPFSKKTWNQRYKVYDQCRVKSSNIAFIYVGGQHDIDDGSLESPILMDYVKHFEAIIFYLEHRFYGKSRPTDDLSLTSLQYLSSQQALADTAYFIKAMNEKYDLTKNVKWIAFGYSYSGTLAVWLRLLYPHFVHGVVAIGAPLLAKMNYYEYFGTIITAIFYYHEACGEKVKDGVYQIIIQSMFPEGQQNVYELFNLCSQLVTGIHMVDDLSLLFIALMNNVMELLKSVHVSYVCEIMTNPDLGTPMRRLAILNEIILKGYEISCLPYNFTLKMELLKCEKWANGSVFGSLRQSLYQQCTEFGYFQTSDYDSETLGNRFPLDFFVKECQEAFIPYFNHNFIRSAIDKTNFFYGGKDIQVSNVVYVYGSLDPWYLLGITETTNNKSSVITVYGYGHDAGFSGNMTNNSQVKNAIKKSQESIEYWLTI